MKTLNILFGIVIGLTLLFIISCERMLLIEPQKTVSITIDDAPAFIESTQRMLEVLKKHDVSATFFAIGYYIDHDTLHLADSIAKYNTLANHTYTHPHLNLKSLSASYKDEILGNQIIIDSINRKYNKPLNKFFRAPYSAILDCQQDTLEIYGYHMSWWDSDASDWNPDVTVNEIVNLHMAFIHNRDHTDMIFHLSNNSILGLDSLLTIFEDEGIKVIDFK